MGMAIYKHLTPLLLLAFAATSGMAAGNEKAGEEKSAACSGCHGEKGHSLIPLFPKLSGQNAKYLERQLHEFRSGKRVNSTMNAMAEALSDEDITDIAAYYAREKSSSETSEPNRLGQSLFTAGKVQTATPACTGCHGPKGSGNPSAGFPLIGGQHAAYIEKTLTDYRSGERANDPNAIMRQIAQKLTDSEITALAEHITTLK